MIAIHECCLPKCWRSSRYLCVLFGMEARDFYPAPTNTLLIVHHIAVMVRQLQICSTAVQLRTLLTISTTMCSDPGPSGHWMPLSRIAWPQIMTVGALMSPVVGLYVCGTAFLEFGSIW